jgi:hypothetical protein
MRKLLYDPEAPEGSSHFSLITTRTTWLFGTNDMPWIDKMDGIFINDTDVIVLEYN